MTITASPNLNTIERGRVECQSTAVKIGTEPNVVAESGVVSIKGRHALSTVRAGDVHGRLVILENGCGGLAKVPCRCSCGKVKNIAIRNLVINKTLSCGCLQREKAAIAIRATGFKHGLSESPIFYRWSNMKRRCTNKNSKDYTNYGGRGIKYDKKWESFLGFLQDMGDSWSDGLSLERIDVNGGYCKENCKWIKIGEQANNKRNTIYVSVFGEKMSLMTACRKYKVRREVAVQRLKSLGWDPEKTFTQPAKHDMRKDARIMEIDGRKILFSRACKLLSIKQGTVHSRIKLLNWTHKEALFTPIRKDRSEMIIPKDSFWSEVEAKP